jgi:Phosphotransferase enzyme family
MLNQSEVPHYLLQRDFITAASIVDEDLRVVEASRRNRNFKVIAERGPSYLLKQGLGTGRRATVAHESDLYRYMESAAGEAFRPYLPGYHHFDSADSILLLEFITNAQDIREYHTRRGAFSTTIARALGQALAVLHRLDVSSIRSTTNTTFAPHFPWALTMHRPGVGIFQDTSAANMHLVRILQNTPGFTSALDRLCETWRSDSLVHNDIKWDNCLVFSRSSSPRDIGLKLVDWEFARLGDSDWDAGSVFSNYLSFWLFSIPVSGEEPPDRFLELAVYPLERMQPAIRAFWKAYVRGMSFTRAQTEEHLLRATQYAAVRLLQTGYEHMQRASQLSGNIICLLQLSLNIIQRPFEAIAHLLGISLPSRGDA